MARPFHLPPRLGQQHRRSGGFASLNVAVGLGGIFESVGLAGRDFDGALGDHVAGYSRLMGDDEAATVRTLTEYRDVLRDHIERHHGRVVDSPGDNLLAEFASPVEAVQAAAEIQRELARRNRQLAEHRRMEFRIGINLGDVLEKDGALFGDGVNIAARLEGLATPGGISVSGTVFEQVEGKLDLAFTDSGEHEVKNIARPVRAYRVDADAATPSASEPTLALPDKPSIAVLPFDNLSGDPDQEYFADGIAEDIITGLSRNRGFFVIARNSSFTYKGQAVNVTQVSRELGVRYVLEGSVRKAGNRVRITAQLIDATTGNHLWADRYDRDLEDIFAVQDEITQTVVATVAPELLTAEMQRAQRKAPENLDAWDCVLRAFWHVARATEADNKKARALAEQAIASDPGGAAGYCALAVTHFTDSSYGWGESAAQSVGAARDAAQLAVEKDDRDALAHTVLGFVYLVMRRHGDAIRRSEIAVELDPNLPLARAALGGALAMSGKPEEGIAHLDEALRLSPRDPFKFVFLCQRGLADFGAERYEEAVTWARRSLEERAGYPSAFRLLAASHGQLDQLPEARAAYEEFRRAVPGVTLEATKTQVAWGSPADLERYLDGLRKAGME